jgi:hypothetical protein
MTENYVIAVVFKHNAGFERAYEENKKYVEFLKEALPGKYWFMTDLEYESADTWEGFLGLKDKHNCDEIVWSFQPQPEDLAMAKKYFPEAQQLVLEIEKCSS